MTSQQNSREQHNEYLSPNQKALRRLKRNKAAMFGLVIIVLAVFIALFAYAIVPDSTPDANDQILQLSTKSPGFTVDIIKKRKNRKIAEKNIISFLIGGEENDYEAIPFTEHRFDGDKLLFREYTGELQSKGWDTLDLVDIAFPLDVLNGKINRVGDGVQFQTIEGKREEIKSAELQRIVDNDHLSKRTFLLGTDKFGRDNLSRLILGVRVSLSVGLVAVLISLIIGITMGALAGYYRGWVDDLIMWIINVFWSIPLLLWVFALVLALGREFWQIFLAVGLVMWVEVARIVRGQFFSVREKEYIEAAQGMAFSDRRIIFLHVLPNIVGPIIVITAANFASAIIIEAGLSFLGIGVQPPKPSWGTTLFEYYKYIGSTKSFLAILPGVAILILTLGFNLLGNGLRDALDVKTKQ